MNDEKQVDKCLSRGRESRNQQIQRPTDGKELSVGLRTLQKVHVARTLYKRRKMDVEQ